MLFLNQIGSEKESFFTTLQPKILEKKHHTAIKV